MFLGISMGRMKDGFSGHCFRAFAINTFCCLVAVFDLVHDVEAIHSLCKLLT